jgi:hypothetical protein
MRSWVQRFLWIALGLLVMVASTAALFIFTRLRSNETTGLSLIGSWQSTRPGPIEAPPPWKRLIEETPANESKRNPNLEIIRFLYFPSFHPQVCVTAWKDGNECWIRSTVCQRDPNEENVFLWQKTERLPLAKWNTLVSTFQRKTVYDPLNGAPPQPGLDGSSWILESSIGGRVTSAEVDNPVTSKGPPHFETIKPRNAVAADFVDTCQFLLNLGGVKVPIMY